jgi:NhaP-type Na+/H+ or K+/H+ antiporter
MEYLIIGIATGFNILLVISKFRRKYYDEAFIEISTLLFISYLFQGTLGGVIIGMIGSVVVSIYLIVTRKSRKGIKDEYEEFRKILQE